MKYQLRSFFTRIKLLSRQPVLTLLMFPDLKNHIEPLFFLIRWIIPVAVFFRYILHQDKGLLWPSHNIFYLVLFLFLIYLLISEKRFHTLYKDKQEVINVDLHSWRVFASFFAAADIVFITVFYVLTNTPRSDVPYLYVIPIVWSVMFMPLRNNLFSIICVSISFSIGTIITIYLSSGIGGLKASELLLILMPKVMLLPIIVLYLIWIHAKLKLSENINTALFDESPDGISFIGQKKVNQPKSLVDMQILKMNRAQMVLSPTAKPGSESCRSEFLSYSKLSDPNAPCPWCPASSVLDDTSTESFRSLTKSFYKITPDSKEEISFSDASASSFKDEKNKTIAAIKFVKDVTPQVYSAFLAGELFLFEDEDNVFKKAVEYFRKMFKADFVKLAKFESEVSRLTEISQSTKEFPDGVIVSGLPFSISTRSISILESCPSEIDIIESGTDEDTPNCLFWNDYCIPDTTNSSVREIADNFFIINGLIVPIKIRKVLWGVILISRGTGDNVPKTTQFDVLQAQMSAQITAVSLERINMLKQKDSQYQASSRNTSDLQLLCSDILHIDNYERTIALGLIGTTCKLGLRYSRAMYLKFDNEQLLFQFGIGPIALEEAKSVWENEHIERISDYYAADKWFDAIVSNNLTKIGTEHRGIDANTIAKSVVLRALKDRQTYQSDSSDAFAQTTLAMSLRFESEFVVSPLYFGPIIHGVIIADKKYLPNEHITTDERIQLLFLSSFVGACASGLTMNAQLKNAPLQFLTAVHDLLRKKYQEKGIDVFQFVNLAERLACAKGFSQEDVNIVKVNALAVNFVHLCFSDDILFSEEKITSGHKYYNDIKDHPEKAEKLIRMIGSKMINPESAAKHNFLFDVHSNGKDVKLDEIAKLLAISEYYLALTNPKKYKGVSPKNSNSAISELYGLVHETDKELINLLKKAVEEHI